MIFEKQTVRMKSIARKLHAVVISSDAVATVFVWTEVNIVTVLQIVWTAPMKIIAANHHGLKGI